MNAHNKRLLFQTLPVADHNIHLAINLLCTRPCVCEPSGKHLDGNVIKCVSCFLVFVKPAGTFRVEMQVQKNLPHNVSSITVAIEKQAID